MRRELPVPSDLLRTRWGTVGDLAIASFAVAAVSGAVLAVPYDSHDAYASVARLLLAEPAAIFLRNLHYWSSQFCLVLSIWHVADHLRVGTERRLAGGVWVRAVITLPVLGFIMLSGFLLRGDAEAGQALRILTEATSQVPLAGPLLATFLFGAAERLNVVYIQHAAVAVIVVWLLVVEHARRMWPRPSSLLAVTMASAAISLVASPGLHDGLDPTLKGPWYFLGLQELLHWTSWPILVVGAGAAVLAAVVALRWLSPRPAREVKIALLALLVVYGGLCGAGAFLRGADWAWSPGAPAGSGALRFGVVFLEPAGAPHPLPAALPTAMGRPEGCLVCHKGVTGLGDAHRPDALGCASCHGGDVFTIDKVRAHRGMTLIPGNLASAERACGQPACHPTVVPRVERSVMTTMSGIVAVDRQVFGEGDGRAANRPVTVEALGHTAADTHLRQLCASCHLGQVKTELGPAREDSRGGGCNACHLSYSPEALRLLERYRAARASGAAEPPRVHPALSLDIGDAQCFGCHSRSGRISTSYEGWNELHDPPPAAPGPNRPGPARYRTLADGRIFERELPDVHQQRGMDCIDCHTATEVMGDGTAHARKRDQLRVSCEDCHARPGAPLEIVPASRLDPESRKIVALRNWPGPRWSGVGRSRDGSLLVNVVAGAKGVVEMIQKRTGKRLPLKAALPVCAAGAGHARLSCGSCHTAWAPRCTTCHTQFEAKARAWDWLAQADVDGAWEERSGPYAAAPPTLGVRMIPGTNPPRGVVDTFAPGMILTIDPDGAAGPGARPIFRRLYARIEPHTTRREARSCVSCHDDPVAIGYGRGELRYRVGASGGRWLFTPAEKPLPADGLPADAWIPFLGSPRGMASTRDDVRPFTVEEQRKILRVGACLTCHDGASRVMRDSVRDFDALVAQRSPRCVLPVWE